jgi:hypothetical protein
MKIWLECFYSAAVDAVSAKAVAEIDAAFAEAITIEVNVVIVDAVSAMAIVAITVTFAIAISATTSLR